MIPAKNTTQPLLPVENAPSNPPSNAPILDLRYFYGNEVLNTAFYMTPKLLFRNKELSNLSSDGKILYMLLLDRLKLSAKNGLKDDDGRLFVFYTIEEACYELHKSNSTVVKAFSELDSKKGMGLIERHKRGQGKADKIYVKSVASVPADYPTFRDSKRANGETLSYGGHELTQNSGQNMTYTPQNRENSSLPVAEFQPQVPTATSEISQSYRQNQPNCDASENKSTASSVENFSDPQNLHLQNFSTSISRNGENTLQDIQNVHGNKTDITNTEHIKTDVLKPTLPPNPTKTFPQSTPTRDGMEGWMDLEHQEKSISVANQLEQAYHTGQVEVERLLNQLRTNESKLESALSSLMGMDERDFRAKDFDEYTPENFYYRAVKLYQRALTEMLTSEKLTKTKHGYVSYAKVIEKLAPHIVYSKFDGGIRLDSLLDCTVSAYMDASKESEVKYPLPYMKSCIWTTLLEGNIRGEANFHYNFG